MPAEISDVAALPSALPARPAKVNGGTPDTCGVLAVEWIDSCSPRVENDKQAFSSSLSALFLPTVFASVLSYGAAAAPCFRQHPLFGSRDRMYDLKSNRIERLLSYNNLA